MSFNGPKIIVVEDDPGMRGSLEFLLEAHGFSVAAFSAPDDVPEGLAAPDWSCAILDVHLAGANGMTAYEVLRARGSALPAIFITGHADEAIRSHARRLKAVALLEKPFSDDALLEAVGRALAAVATTAG